MTEKPRQETSPGTSADRPSQPGQPAELDQVADPGQVDQPRQPDQPGQVSHAEIDRILDGTHHDPHSVLGAHPLNGGTVVRALRPLAASVAAVLPDGRRFPMAHVHQGVFAAILPVSQVPDYRLAVTYPAPGADGTTLPETITDDPYRHLPTLGE